MVYFCGRKIDKYMSILSKPASQWAHTLVIILLSVAVIILSCSVISMKQQLQELLQQLP